MGAYPTTCYNYYDYDPAYLNRYQKLAQNDETFEKYLKHNIMDLKNHDELIHLSGKNMPHYTEREMMSIVAAREIKDGDIVFCGTGISMLAAMVAKHISAPKSIIFFETGAIDSKLEEVPLAVADPRVMFWASVN